MRRKFKAVAPDGDLILGLPNRETRKAVYGGFIDDVLRDRADDFSSRAREISTLLASNRMDKTALHDVLAAVFSMVPYEWKFQSEAEAKRYFLLFMKMAGATINAEIESSNGRADAVLESNKLVCIFEFKYDKSAKVALAQCHKRNYAAPYAFDTCCVIYVGVNYDTLKRNVDTLNDTVKQNSDTLNDTLKSGMDRRILQLIKQNPGIRRPEIMAALNISESTVARYLRRLTSEVEFRGCPRTGGYYAI